MGRRGASRGPRDRGGDAVLTRLFLTLSATFALASPAAAPVDAKPTPRKAHAAHSKHRAPLKGGTPAKNRRLGRALARARGWGRSWSCLRRLWHRESGWRRHARNAASGAYGIPQALPASKLRAAGRVISKARVQIRWGLRYIARRYGGPCRAWAHSNAVGWY